MVTLKKRPSVKSGLMPGTLVHIGEEVSENTIVEVFEYNADSFTEHTYNQDEMPDFDSLSKINDGTILWINVDGLKNLAVVEQLCKAFNIHSLVMEDVLNTYQRPKIENYDSYLYIVSKMIYYLKDKLINEQLSIILGERYVISFGEKPGDVFDVIRDRIRKNAGQMRKYGADYLAYCLLDCVVDGYFGVLEMLGDRIDELEEILFNDPTIDSLQNMREIKRDLLYIQRSVWPLREVASWMERDGSKLIAASTQVYLRDVYDHIIQVIDTTETLRELIAGLMDIYLSSISNKMNQIMKVLTIISTIFIPLTFIAGIYGMNFKNMPELDWQWGYGVVIIVMVAVAIAMVLYFKRKRWF